MSNDPIKDWLKDCFYDPVKFAEEGFSWGEGELEHSDGLDTWQRDYLQEFGEQLKKHEAEGTPVRMATASGHGIGKSALVSMCILFYMATRENCLIKVTANTEKQLRTTTWREVAKWLKLSVIRHMFRWERESLRSVTQPDTWVCNAVSWSEHNPEAFAGQHEKYTMIVMDEASGIPPIIWQTVIGALTTVGAVHLAFGNPTKPSGNFYDCFNKYSHRWVTRQIDSRTAKMASKKYLQEIIDDYGIDSDVARVRVLGQFPRKAAKQFISTSVVDQAMRNDIPPSEIANFPLMLGVDVARFGDDKTCLVWRRGPKVINIERHEQLDNVQVAQIVASHLERQPAKCFVDEVGLGAGVVDLLRKWSYNITPVNVARKASQPRLYANLRAEIWDLMRKWLETADIPPSDQLAASLTGIEYLLSEKTGQLAMERKQDMKKRGLDSPDDADALALTFVIPGQDSIAFEDEEDWIESLKPKVSDAGRDTQTGY